ncbi:hypothetical protein K466DRAFT_270531 [Polyporus arcularius HHB13444]|uniref:Uncharacterized protein n=1 Tax=Polyporus arcularius HHB13444 TaxID=1314778 RepID=A0A5C3PTS3_9APHY|nr:hypothetical protein K466DRAFT_270531 [Polyporus arcularius HHB13444]
MLSFILTRTFVISAAIVGASLIVQTASAYPLVTTTVVRISDSSSERCCPHRSHAAFGGQRMPSDGLPDCLPPSEGPLKVSSSSQTSTSPQVALPTSAGDESVAVATDVATSSQSSINIGSPSSVTTEVRVVLLPIF